MCQLRRWRSQHTKHYILTGAAVYRFYVYGSRCDIRLRKQSVVSDVNKELDCNEYEVTIQKPALQHGVCVS